MTNAEDDLAGYINLTSRDTTDNKTKEQFVENDENDETKDKPESPPVIIETENETKEAEEKEQAPTGDSNEEEEKYVADNIEKPTILLQRLYDRDQAIPKKVHSQKDDELNKVDPNWKYNITLGDMELRQITHYDGKQETLWFPLETYPNDYFDDIDQKDGVDKTKKKDKKRKRKQVPLRKVYIAFKLKRVDNIDAENETFRMRFHLYFNWMPTEKEYKSWYKVQQEAKIQNNPQLLFDWEPAWYPHIEFQNMVEEHLHEWELYPEEGYFRMQMFKDFAKQKGEEVAENEFDCTKAKFLRAKMECDMTFVEPLELQQYPFDVQDLSCVIHERTTGGMRCIFLPELRKPSFGSFDASYSKIDEWNVENCMIEFGDADPGAARSRSSYSQIVLKIKLSRRWKPIILDTLLIIFLVSVLSFTVFSIEFDDVGGRLEFSLTLLLTAVLFDTKSSPTPYLTYMDKYILTSYAYLSVVMIENSMAVFYDTKFDDIMFWVIFGLFMMQNITFTVYAIIARQREMKKVSMSSDEVEEYNKSIQKERPQLRVDYTKRQRGGTGGRLLIYNSTAVAM